MQETCRNSDNVGENRELSSGIKGSESRRRKRCRRHKRVSGWGGGTDNVVWRGGETACERSGQVFVRSETGMQSCCRSSLHAREVHVCRKELLGSGNPAVFLRRPINTHPRPPHHVVLPLTPQRQKKTRTHHKAFLFSLSRSVLEVARTASLRLLHAHDKARRTLGQRAR